MPSYIQIAQHFADYESLFLPFLGQASHHLWVSLNGAPRRGLLTLFQSSYKNFKGRFLKIRASTGDSSLLNGFPLYWTPNPRFQSARRLEDLSPKDQGICEFLTSSKAVFDTSTLVTKEYLPDVLKAHTGTPFFLPLTKKTYIIATNPFFFFCR